MEITQNNVLVNNQPLGAQSNGSSLESRAYQIEMFQKAMQENIIVAMDTGSGKTQIAKLRIEAELERTPEKRVWFCAPNVVLAQQQYVSLSSYLSAYQLRLITGHDNVESWSTQRLWDAILNNIDIVVSTPQVLLDALTHGFVKMKELSLLVFDEAHHCVASAPMALIMQRFYHPLFSQEGPDCPPHTLGLTASPVTNTASKFKELESNMDAVCKTPTLQIEDYKRHVFLPTLERITFTPSATDSPPSLEALAVIVESLTLKDDPTVAWLQTIKETNMRAQQKLTAITNSGRTPVIKQMTSLLGHAQHICEHVGKQAADTYIKACASRLHEAVLLHEPIVPSLADREQQYIDRKLQAMLASLPPNLEQLSNQSSIAAKARAVIEYLKAEYRPGITVVLFVQRRSVAVALTQIFKSHAEMQEYEVFSFVGLASPARRSLVDLADMQLQNEAFADFKNGKRNICIATQVMEEGIDIQATNVVIRFDDPENFRSFIQSRGRARRPDSKFVMVHPVEKQDIMYKLNRWTDLEQMMKTQYSDLNRSTKERLAMEDAHEEGGELYYIPSTGALLTYENSRQHLEHFCSTLPPEESGELARPTIIVSEDQPEIKSAQVILPSSVPPALQSTNSLRKWRTERMAVRDATFQICKRLHSASLINDNLLPHIRISHAREKMEIRESKYEVREATNPWALLLQRSKEQPMFWTHCIRVTGQPLSFPDMILLAPLKLNNAMNFTLQASSGTMEVQIDARDVSSVSLSLARQVTEYLFQLILGRRLKSVNLNDTPFLILPSVGETEIYTWLEHACRSTPLAEMKFDPSFPNDVYLVKHSMQEILYKWTPVCNGQSTIQYSPNDSIIAERLSKQLSHFRQSATELQTGKDFEPDIRSVAVSECAVQGLEAQYADFMLLMPSISYMLEVALRGELAVEGPLKAIGFSNSKLVMQALTSSSALSEHNYESLEFVGDSILKYYASIQVYFDHPNLTEGGLTAKCHKLINNARLQRVTKDVGLDAYITVKPFSGQRWSLTTLQSGNQTRQMSSKTLADVVEALIGAAYLDDKNGPTLDELPMSALAIFLPEVQWKSPITHVAELNRSSSISQTSIARLEDVENMLGYQFKHKALLSEALTRTSLRAGHQSFQRLEFLGDAILDRIVNVALYKSGIGLEPEHLKYRRDALVNEWTLSFLAMRAHHDVVINNIETDSRGQNKIVSTSRKVRLIDHMKTITSRAQQLQRLKAETTFNEVHEQITAAFENGTVFPWIALHSIDTSKSYSDIVEAILGAVFIDSVASLDACETVLESLGLMALLRRLCTEIDIDLIQPIVRLRLKHLDVVIEQKDTGKLKDDSRKFTCSILLDGVVVSRAESVVSEKHAEACAAQKALDILSLRKCVEDAMEIED